MKTPNILKNTLCYTAGPMDFETDGFGPKWRNYLKEKLYQMGVKILSPYDESLLEFPVETDEAKKDLKIKLKERKFDEIYEAAKLIVRRDLAMVDKSDFLIANINPKIHMCGTYNEIFLAKSEQKPIFIFCEDKTLLPYWILGCIKPRFIFESIDSIIDYLVKIDNRTIKLDNKYWKILKQPDINNWVENYK